MDAARYDYRGMIVEYWDLLREIHQSGQTAPTFAN